MNRRLLILSFTGLLLVVAITQILIIISRDFLEYGLGDQAVLEDIAAKSRTTEGQLNENPVVTAGLSRDQMPDYEVAKVVDGDTIDVLIAGQRKRVRLIGINAPESVDPRRPVQCFGKEASMALKNLLNGQRVFLEADSSQQDQDKYGRLLRFVFMRDGTNVNRYMILNGYAYEYTYDLPYRYQNLFIEAQKTAERKGTGLWSELTCKGGL